jgi:hypothetical protein
LTDSDHDRSLRDEFQRNQSQQCRFSGPVPIVPGREASAEGATCREDRGVEQERAHELARLYAALDANHSLAVAAKLVPNGVICHDSALAFHELTDRIPPFIWVAIGPREWRPKITQPRIQIERFGSKVFGKGIEYHTIERVRVPIYSPSKTIVDLFKSATHQKALYNSPTGFAHATQGMREALRLRKATPAEIGKFAVEAGIWEKVVQPRLEALTVDA